MTHAALLMLREIATRPLAAGDLAVFTDYKGREIGCTVDRIAEGLVWCKVAGLAEWQGPYRLGDIIVIEAAKVRGAY